MNTQCPRQKPKQLKIEIEHKEDVCLLRCKGHFRAGDDPRYLNDRVDEIETLGCKKLIVDFQDVRSLGSAGLSFIVDLYRTCGGRVVLGRTQPRVREVLEITRLSTLIPLVADLSDGVRLPECPASE